MNRFSIYKSMRNNLAVQSIILSALIPAFAGCTMEMETDSELLQAENTSEISQGFENCPANKYWCEEQQRCIWFYEKCEPYEPEVCTTNKYWCEEEQRCVWYHEPCAPENVALGKPATHSSGSPAPAVVTDGVFVTSSTTIGWADPAYTFPFYGHATVDVGKGHTVYYLVYQEYHEGCPGDIAVSADGINWTNSYTASNSPGGWNMHTVTFPSPVQARYVRYTSHHAYNCRQSLSEIQAWGY
jgi:hypothetical protein